jgi:cell division cycle 20, cofactor of APC complex
LIEDLVAKPLKGSDSGPKNKPTVQSSFAFSSPCRVLDAPGLIDDYYLNIMDWSLRNTLAIALGSSVYLWNDGAASELFTVNEEEYCCGIGWIHDGTCLAASLSNGTVQIWDATKGKRLRTIIHSSSKERVSSLSWNKHLLSTGAHDGTLQTHDVRIASHLVQNHGQVHTGEICNLKWSPDGRFLASGSADSRICILEGSKLDNTAFELLGHKSATKALAWCPWQPGLLLSGSGAADPSIKLWDIISHSQLASVDTGAQVCSVQWSKTHRQFYSTHGTPSNSLSLWHYPKMRLISQHNQAHSSRILHMSLSPDGKTVVTAGADECIKFWSSSSTDIAGSVPLVPRIMQTKAKLVTRKSPFSK